ncbi:MAG TPA: type I-B CRISPR-associated protein Cas5 [Candidatus Atribacteria bacterium]|nr:MAG: type I-B CRISPR-associated protein Cas5 [Fusobacteriia bacterium 4572_132]HDK25687.1 type I-B CRISPR-associated protein Cas5 [Candidatus Atribacteria bacterium]
MNKVLVFDVWGDYAHFRRFYTTTSPLSFPIPPRTALCGLIGAIIGLEKEGNDYLNYFSIEFAHIALRLLNPIKKTVIAENLINTKNARGPGMNLITNRTQIRFEFLKDQKYRIYFYYTDEEDDSLYQKLKYNLTNHKTKYTPCLGLSENIANFKFIGEFKIKNLSPPDVHIPISTVIPLQKISQDSGISFEREGEYFSIRVPVELNTKRVVTKYRDIIFDRKGRPIKAKLKEPHTIVNYADGRSENIVFIE